MSVPASGGNLVTVPLRLSIIGGKYCFYQPHQHAPDQRGGVRSTHLIMNYNQTITAVPVGSADLNQGPTALPLGRGNVQQVRLPKPKKSKKNKVTELHIATYNVRTLSEDCHLTSLENEIKHIKWDIIGISEMRRPGENLMELASKHILFNKGTDQKERGVGFLVHKNLQGNIQEFHATSDRVASVTINISKRYKIKIIQIYAPTSLSTQDVLDEFYDDLQTEMQNQKAHYNIIMGDFNAKVGDGDEECVGSFGYGTRNDRGDDLVNFATAHGFKIVNTFFKKSKNRRWTWHSPNFEVFNEIDYILTDKFNIIKNIEVLNRVNVGSDHRMVRCRIQIDAKRERNKLFHSKSKPLRISQSCLREFKLDLKNRYAALEEDEDQNSNSSNTCVNDLNYNIVKPLADAARNWSENSKKPDKFSEETKNLMKKRKTLRTPVTDREKVEIVELNKLIRKKQKQDLRKYRTSTIQEIIKQGRGFKMAKRKLNRGRLQFTGVLEEDDTVTTDRKRIVERSREFYENLYSTTHPVDQQTQLDHVDVKDHHQFESFPSVEAWEVKLAVKQSKKGKAPGPDNITTELIEAADELIYGKLATLFNECLHQSTVPEQWNEAIIILLHKKGDQRNLSNYRPISLLNNIYKLFTKIITNRISRTLDDNQPREQAGFRKGFSTTDHLHAVNQLIEKCAEYKIPLVVALVDYNKAFDSVEIPDVIEALQEQGVETVYVNVLQHIYKQAKSFIRLHQDSRPFQLSRGVRQGDTSSPKLFTACLEKVFRNLSWEHKGIKIDGEFLNHLRFADDIIIFANRVEELQQMLIDLSKKSIEVGLSMNFKKTKIMCNEYVEDKEETVTIDNNTIEEVDHYIYLGQRISMNSASKEQEIKRRITLGWQAFGRTSAVFKNKEIPLVLKRQVYDQCILPTVNYGSETWNLTKTLTLKLRTMQRAHERIMLGITWRDHKTAEWIREKTKVRDILETISKAKWKWAGHVLRRNDNRWTTRLTTWQPRGHKRNRGRQKTRWRDDLDKFNKHWQRDALDRIVWRKMREAYVQQRTFKG